MTIILYQHYQGGQDTLCFRHAVLRSLSGSFVHVELSDTYPGTCDICLKEKAEMEGMLSDARQGGYDYAIREFNKRQLNIQDSGLTPVVEGVQPVADLLTRYECIGKGAQDHGT